jgi:hypothetical protein
MSSRRAEVAKPFSQRTPVSARKPSRSTADRSLRAPSGVSIQMSKTPVGDRKCTSQSSVVARALIECSRQASKATSYWVYGMRQLFVVSTREYPSRYRSRKTAEQLDPATMIRCDFVACACSTRVFTIRSSGGTVDLRRCPADARGA